MPSRIVVFSVVVLAFGACSLLAAEQAQAPAPETSKRESFADPVAGYSLLLPAGYRKLTDEEIHNVFKGLSEHMGDKISERARKRPPAYFTGPDSQRVGDQSPPALTIAFTEHDTRYDPALIREYKEKIVEDFRREGEKIGEPEVAVVKVDGINSLQVEYDSFGPNKERWRSIKLTVPGNKKSFDLAFNFSPEQNDAVHAALKDVLDSFKLSEHPPANVANQNKWLRIAYITLGCGLAGVLLSLILQKLRKN